MWNRRRRAAISQSEIRKRCKPFGPLAEGYRAYCFSDLFEQTRVLGVAMNPYRTNSSNWKAWMQGWKMAADKQQEKDNERPG